jgi:hypothetical protein
MRLLGRRRTVLLVLLILLAVLSVRPVPAVEPALEVVFAPTRWIAQLVAPLEWLRAGEVRAAEARLDGLARDVRGEAAQLLALEQRAALPRPELQSGRRLIHGEVLRRSRGDLDRIEVHVASTDGIVPGLPVVTGDHYVGRVARVDRLRPNLVHVDLVTRGGFRAGASVRRLDGRGRPVGAPVRFVVGGLAKEVEGDREGQLHLALHNPTLRGVLAGEVVVDEPEDLEPELARLSRGFRVGQLETVRAASGARLHRIGTPLDFRSGLFQVLVLAPGEGAADPARLELDTFVEGNWIPARALTRGDVTATREGRRLSRGSLSGVREGAAVALGAHLVGRVGETAPTTADLLGLGDPGLRLAVLARLDGEAAPRPLGELVALGRDRGDGRLRFRWICRVDIAPGPEGGPREAELYTGSGEEGVPRGLYVGRTRLPVGRGEHELLVEQDGEVRELQSAFVWSGAERARRVAALREEQAR